MTKYIIKRILLALFTCFIVLSVTYILISLLKVEKIFSPNQGTVFAYYMDQVNKGFLTFTENIPTDFILLAETEMSTKTMRDS